MFWAILIGLLVLWLVGMVPALGVGRSIHILPVVAVIVLIVRLVSARIVL
ncbi:MAG: lmo0937 family membrane protein [Thermoanaerobaculia bacterium]|nr:MAG: lmo0937 family membrane protein [Thermoanaerobaculia bacterium]